MTHATRRTLPSHVLLVSAVCLSASATWQLAAAPAADEPGPAIQQFLAQNTGAQSYKGVRRLEASGRGQTGWLDARTNLSPTGGFDYQVTAEGGSGFIRSRVLRSLLEEERRLVSRGGAREVALSTANYTFTDMGLTDDGLLRVAMQPRRKERPLVIGHLFLSPADGELVRVEGRLAKNPSFWVSRVNIVRRYARINGALVPVLLESTAQLRLLGRSSLRMTYHYLEIDQQPAVEAS